MNRRYLVLSLAMSLLAAGAFFVAQPHLPERIPTHWNLAGEVDGYSPQWFLFLFGPGFMLINTLVFLALPILSPKKASVESFPETYRYIALVVTAMLGYLYGVLLYASLTGLVDAPRAIFGGVAVLFAMLGNVLGKTRRNFFIGIRTPWTLSSERVWYATHRMAAKAMVASGLLCLAVVLIEPKLWIAVCAAILAAGGLLPVAYSLVYYKRLESRGELDIGS
jgi:uncharacterized membrane protein